MIKIENVSKAYKGKWALKNFSVELNKGEIIGLVGPNGAGKTTLLKCITNLIINYKGQINFDKKYTLGLVLDDLKTYSNRSLKFNLNYFKIIKNLENYDNAISILKTLNFDTNLLSNRLRSFSYGMNKKVVSSLSLMSNPDIVLLDEPFRGLDFESINSFKILLKRFKEEGKIVLFSSHNLQDVEEICDTVLVINNGKLLRRINAKETGNSKNIVFSTNNNQLAIQVISEFSPNLNGDQIILELEEKQWNSVLKILIENEIELLSVKNNYSLMDRVINIVREDRNRV